MADNDKLWDLPLLPTRSTAEELAEALDRQFDAIFGAPQGPSRYFSTELLKEARYRRLPETQRFWSQAPSLLAMGPVHSLAAAHASEEDERIAIDPERAAVLEAEIDPAALGEDRREFEAQGRMVRLRLGLAQGNGVLPHPREWYDCVIEGESPEFFSYLRREGIDTVIIGGAAARPRAKLLVLALLRAGVRVVLNLAALDRQARDTADDLQAAGALAVPAARQLESLPV